MKAVVEWILSHETCAGTQQLKHKLFLFLSVALPNFHSHWHSDLQAFLQRVCSNFQTELPLQISTDLCICLQTPTAEKNRLYNTSDFRERQYDHQHYAAQKINKINHTRNRFQNQQNYIHKSVKHSILLGQDKVFNIKITHLKKIHYKTWIISTGNVQFEILLLRWSCHVLLKGKVNEQTEFWK